MTKRQLVYATISVCVFSLHLNAFSQTTINSAANRAIIDGKTFEYSIGEMTLVNTERNHNIIITQGYLQPQLTFDNGSIPSNSQLSALADKIKVYPNPTESVLYIESTEDIINDLTFQLLDAAGKTVIGKIATPINGTNKCMIDLSSISSGSYFLLIHQSSKDQTSKEGNMNDLSFKIQKVN